MRRALLLWFAATCCTAQAPKLTWEQAVSDFYRAASLSKALELQAHLAHDAAVEAAAKLPALCDGTVEGIEQLKVTCKK